METLSAAVELAGVERVHAPSRREFFRRWFDQGRPVLMTGLMDNWPAMGKWSLDFFRRIGKGIKVKIEHGNVLQETPKFDYWDLDRYLDKLSEPASSQNPPPYLAYFDIFKRFPELARDVDFGFWRGRMQDARGWIGPAGTFTGLHWDIAPNLFAQFLGSKEFMLYPPGQSRWLYPSRKYDIGSVLSDIDAKHPDFGRFPLFAKAEGIRVKVEAGQILFTPRGWWHQVLGLETSISVSCFGFGFKEILLYALPAIAKHGFHRMGWYRKGNCACHLPGGEPA